MKARFVTNLEGVWINDKEFDLLNELVYASKVLNKIITVPEGFVTDFASVPRLPIVYSLFGNKAHHEAVIHDYLYRVKPHICTRLEADKVFLEAMKVRGKNILVRRAMYLGVRLGGSSSWA